MGMTALTGCNKPEDTGTPLQRTPHLPRLCPQQARTNKTYRQNNLGMSPSRGQGIFLPGSFAFNGSTNRLIMKTTLFLILAGSVALIGCGKNSSPPAPSTNATTSGSVLTAPVDYLGAIGKAQQNAVKTVDTTSLTQAIQLFNVDKGRNPKDLNELVQEKYIPQIPHPALWDKARL